MVRTAFVAAASALTIVSTDLTAQTLGIATCDDFLKKYETCITSQVAAAQRATFQGQFDQWRKTWSDMAKNPSTKAGLENACKQSAEQMKAAMSGFGCSF
jgi:hypothetical protein